MAYESYRYRRTKSKCGECPLDGCTKVWGISGIKAPTVVLIGEAPGENEDEEGVPFVGPAGRWLQQAVKYASLPYYAVHKTNVLSCRPPKNDIDSQEGMEARENCRPGFLEEIQDLYKNGAKVFIPLGSTALHAMGIELSISKARGSVFPVKLVKGVPTQVEGNDYDFLVVPTFHPSFIMRGQTKQEATWINDLVKAFEFGHKSYKPPKEHFEVFPSADEIVERCNWLVENKKMVGVDIEATSLVAHNAEIIVTGLAWSGEHAISVPFVGRGGKQIWKVSERKAIDKALRAVLAKCPTVFQNALYDTRVLAANKYPVKNLKHDVLLMHHNINPELPHSLGYIVSSYGKTPFWKDIVLNDPKRMLDTDPETLRTYNLRDSVVLLQVLPELEKDLKQVASPKIYKDVSMGLVKAVTTMMDNGMPLSHSRVKSFRAKVKQEVEETERALREEVIVPESFNLQSPEHIRYLLYGIEPPSFPKKLKSLSEYQQPGTKKKKNTKAYRTLLASVEAIRSTRPLPLVVTPGKTESNQAAIDKRQLMNVRIGLNNRRQELANLKRRTQKHEQEEEDLERLDKFLTYFHHYQARNKILSMYTSFATGPDGRVHFPYKIHGTYTGRLASGDKKKTGVGNAQNIPKEARKLFKAEDGNVILQADYSNLELRVLALVSDDDVLIKTFEDYDAGRGPKPHAVNTQSLFGIDKDHPDWDKRYRLAKTYIFGRNYGGSLRGIYEKIIQEDPDMDLTFAQFKEIDETYRSLHPKYAEWREQLVNTVKSTRRLENAFGRIRYFQGAPHEIEREGLNFPIQSTASDVLNYALIDVDAALAKKSDVMLIGTVHDSILVEAPKSKQAQAAKILKTCMEQKFTINGKETRFPVDVEAGPSWGELEELDI